MAAAMHKARQKAHDKTVQPPPSNISVVVILTSFSIERACGNFAPLRACV